MLNTILVLMPTYNGQEYIISQIDSILNQKNVDVHLLIRDDGSKDNTVNIIQCKYSSNPKVELFLGNNIGCVNSFNFLVREAVKRKEFEYFAFSDQDDVWDEHKLITGIDKLKTISDPENCIPLVYCCNLMISDSKANPIRPLYTSEVKLKKSNMLVTNKGAGCTMVFNRTIAQIYTEHQAQFPSYHDYWMALIAFFFGKMYFDNTCYIFYRQHTNNVVGLHSLLNWKLRLKNIIKVFLSKDNSHIDTLTAFYNEFKYKLKESDGKKFLLMINYKKSIFNKIRILCSWDFYPDSSFIKNPLKYFSFVIKVIFEKL